MAQTQANDAYLVDDEDDETSYMENHYMLFTLAGDHFGVGIAHITDVIELPALLPVPNAPDFVKGVMHLRGKIISVWDLRKRFAMPPRESGGRNCVIVLTSGDQTVGIVVDAVLEVVEIAALQKSTDMGKHFSDEKLIKGVGHVNGRVKIILDVFNLIENETQGVQHEN
ncbi:MAG: chemotaxis protein CheW [Spirochaetia bacterium]|nr:chemotaxis protein CheW [Spirochaetia bacterium]